jgi:hypothetical protein
MNSSNFKNIILQKNLLEEPANPKSKYRKLLIKKSIQNQFMQLVNRFIILLTGIFLSIHLKEIFC